MTVMTGLVEKMLRGQPERQEEPAVIQTGPNAHIFSYSQLDQCVERLRKQMESIGLKEGSVCSILLPNSSSFVATFLAVLDLQAMAAPLNPASKKDEIKFSLNNLGSDMLVGPKGFATSASEYGDECALAECYWHNDQIVLDVVRQRKEKTSEANGDANAKGENFVALALHTSGTTGTPKAVPLLQSNLEASAKNVVEAYGLAPKDRSMLIMPLFHIHGIVAGLLAPLTCGSCVIIPEKGLGPDFWDDFTEHKATWWTATPTHQKIILTFPRPQAGISPRFIRSCSSPLPPTTLHELERTFGAPVLEAYAMTENAHHIASNLEAGPRSPGSVGKPCDGVSLKIIGDDENVLGPRQRGEVVIKGPSVTPGYLRNPEANKKGFTSDGYFRTGDQGELDENGHLWLTGRLKEIINKGGEKISPNELDNVILEHPDVASAVSFAIPDDMYGEEVGAAVVLRQGKNLTPSALKRWLRERVSAFRVPREAWVIDSIPLTATGKIQRNAVAKLMLSQKSDSTPAAGAEVSSIKSLWAQVLGLDEGDIKESDQYFDIGGDSVAAIKLANAAKKAGLGLDTATIFRFPTLGEMAKRCPATKQNVAQEPTSRPGDLLDACAIACAVSRDAIEDVAPATGMQGIVTDSNRVSGAWVANLKFACHNVSLAQIEACMAIVRERHPILRTRTVLQDGKYYLVVVKDQAIWETSACLDDYLASVQGVRFQLGSPQIRLGYIFDERAGPYVVFSMSHAIGDVWSRNILYEEISQGLKDPESLRGMPKPTSYLRFAEAVNEVDVAKAKQFHDDMLQGFERWSYLPHEAGTATNENISTRDKILEISGASNSRYGQVLKVHLAWALTLSIMSGDNTIFFPSVTSGRLLDVPGVESAMGPTLALVPIALRLAPDVTVSDTLETIRTQLYDGVPYEQFGAANTFAYFNTFDRETVLNCSEVSERDGMVIPAANRGELRLELDESKALYGKMSVDYHMRVSECPGGLKLCANWKDAQISREVVEKSVEYFAAYLQAVSGAATESKVGEIVAKVSEEVKAMV